MSSRLYVGLPWIALTVICAAIVFRTPIVTDITAFLPGPATDEQRQLAEQLRDGTASRVALIGLDGDAPPTLARVSESMQRTLQADPRFTWVSNGNAAQMTLERERLFAARYVLSPRVNADRFAETGLRQAAVELESLLRSSAAPLIKPFAARDPTGELITVATQLGGASAPNTQHGVWFDSAGESAILIAVTRDVGFDVDAQQIAKEAIDTAFANARRDAGSTSASLHITGPGMFAVLSRDAIRGDAERLAIVASLAIATLLYLALRSVRFLLVAALPVGIGTLAGLAAVALAFGGVHGITLGFGMTLIGEAVDYAIYVQVQRRGTTDDRALWRALWLAVLTSTAGFVAMMLSGFLGLVQLGLLSVVGIGVAAAVARFWLPTLLPIARADALTRLDWVSRVAALAPRVRGVVLVLAAAATVFIGVRAGDLWNDNLSAISPLAPGAGERDAAMRTSLGLPDLRYVITVSGTSLDEALAASESLHAPLETLVQANTITRFDSPARLIPSRSVQLARQSALPDADSLRARLRGALQGTALRPTAFEPFVADVSAARVAAPITVDHYAGTGLGARLGGQLKVDADRATVFVTVAGVTDATALRRAVTSVSGAALLDLAEVQALVADYRTRAALAAVGGAALVVLLLAVQLRNLRATARIALSLGCAAVLTTAALIAIDGRLTLFHLVALLLVVGIGSNYALFFGLPRQDGDADRAVAASVGLCMMTTLIAFALLATSTTPVLHMIGLTAAIGAVMSFVAAMAVAQPNSIAKNSK